MTVASALVDALWKNFSLQLEVYDELAGLARRQLEVFREDPVQPDAVKSVLGAKEAAMGRIDALMRENRELREKGAADWDVPEINLSILEREVADRGRNEAAGACDVTDLRRILEQLSERMRALDDLERQVEQALQAVRSGVLQEMKRLHTGQDVLGAYRRAAHQAGDSHFMDRKR